jgi:hypothetical protein
LPAWKISFDTELMSADNTFTRISPRQSQEYRIFDLQASPLAESEWIDHPLGSPQQRTGD